MSSRSVEDLTPWLKEKCLALIEKSASIGIKIALTCTARYYKEQVALYAQGRQSLDEVNALRKIAGLPPISLSENKYCVTWTMLSKHIVNLEDNDSTNNKARAFDFVVIDEKGKASWDLKVNVNKNNIPDYVEVGMLAESLGMKAGMRFKDKLGRNRPDYPHIEQP